MEDLLPYFERELVYLRRLGREFYERYPRVGGALQLGDDTCPDPHVEQLIQSVALLSARVAKRLDDSYPELTEALLETLFPHYLRPFPSCSIVRATYPSIKSAGEAPMLTIPRGTEMDSSAVDGVRCSFKTAYDIVLSPMTLAGARFDPVVRAPSCVTLPASASAVLSIVIDGAAPAELPALRVFIDGEPSFCAALRDALFMHTVCAYVETEPGRWTALPAVPLAPVGFAEDEALIPFDARSHVAYRVLSEYFVFPEKFNFFDIDMVALRALLPQGCRRFTFHVALAGLRPDSSRARMLASLTETNLLLGCSPVVNLFQRPGQPIPLSAFKLQNGSHNVQLLRTQPQHIEKTVKECYANLNRQALRYIFIQNQYVQYAPWAEHLIECVGRLRSAGYLKPMYVFILTSTPETDSMDLPTYDLASKVGMSETMKVEHERAMKQAREKKTKPPISAEELSEQGINVFMGSLWTCARDKDRLQVTDYEEIYIHTKVAIVDDAAFTIGSANLNLRSMALDSELNVLSEAKEVAFQLRCDLFSQCSGMAGPAQFGDMARTFKDWQDIATANADFKTSRTKLKSQLLPFYVDRKPGWPVV